MGISLCADWRWGRNEHELGHKLEKEHSQSMIPECVRHTWISLKA